MPARKLAQYADDSASLRAIARVSSQAARLQRILLEALPAEFSATSRVGWTRSGVLCVVVANGATGAKLRQMSTRILDHFRRQGFEFNSMRIEVQVTQGAAQPRTRRSKVLPPQALAAIERLQRTLAQGPLRAALTRLARKRPMS